MGGVFRFKNPKPSHCSSVLCAVCQSVMGNDGLECWGEVIEEVVGVGTSVWRCAAEEGVWGQKPKTKPPCLGFGCTVSNGGGRQWVGVLE